MCYTKDEIFNMICSKSKLGRLGYFVGAGFSKAVLEDNPKYQAYNWNELLKKCCAELEIRESDLNKCGSNPEYASAICRKYAKEKGRSYDDSVKIFKEKVCQITNTYATKQKRDNYKRWIYNILPSWIVTTNYDILLEHILGARALSVSRNNCFLSIKEMIPVIHIHGICTEPNEIVITHEDYAKYYRPSDYWHQRLPFLFKESCVVMIGYGLGDTNILAALDWARNVYTNANGLDDPKIIQVVYKEDNPRKDPYIDENEIIILETDNLEKFFCELDMFMGKFEVKYKERSDSVKEYIDKINNEIEKNVQSFIDDKEFRKNILDFLKNLEYQFGYFYNTFIKFMGLVMLRLNELSREKSNFEAYNTKLCIILDIFINIPLKKLPISLRGLLAYELNKTVDNFDVSGIQHTNGKSNSATKSWQYYYRDKLPAEVIDELWLFYKSNTNEFVNLKPLLESIPSKEPV